MDYFVQMLLNFPKQEAKPVTPRIYRSTDKARAAHKEKVRNWFIENMKDQELTTTQIASRRGQTNASCLPLLYDLEREGFIRRVGVGQRKGRGQPPVIWKLVLE